MKESIKHPQIPIPQHMIGLPVSDKGYLKPWFVTGDDFRVVDNSKAVRCVRKEACWICGKPFDEGSFTLVGDPVSAMFLFFLEPPCHLDCAQYAMQVCPFVLYPTAKRRDAGLPQENTLKEYNLKNNTKLHGENPGKYYLVRVRDFYFDTKSNVIRAKESSVLERQLWIGGVRQAEHPVPIVKYEDLPIKLKSQIRKQN